MSPKINLVLDRDLLEVTDQDFDPGTPAAGHRQLHAVDLPDRCLHVSGRQAQRLDSGIGLGENERNLFCGQRTELAIKQIERDPPAIGARGPDLQVGHRPVGMDMNMSRLIAAAASSERGGGVKRHDATRPRINATIASSARIDRPSCRADRASPVTTRGVSRRFMAASASSRPTATSLQDRMTPYVVVHNASICPT